MQIPAQSWLQQAEDELGFTKQQKIRAQFVSDVSIYQAEMLIFLDETGADRRDSLKHCFLTSCPLMEKIHTVW